MCGLAGIVNVPNARHTVEAMVRSIAHRGPDASGVFVWGAAKLKGRESKSILKEAANGWIPRDVIWRPKAGFGAPLRARVRKNLSPKIDAVVHEGRPHQAGIFNERTLGKGRRSACKRPAVGHS